MFRQHLLYFVIALAMLAPGVLRAAPPVTDSGIPLDAPWKIAVHDFAVQNVRHPSWGLAHSERNYHNSLHLAEKMHWKVDAGALFAAAFLHDVGGIGSFQRPGVDHAVRSVEIAQPLLEKAGFPADKWPLVRQIILGHTYYSPTPTGPETLVFRDADLLDFLGSIGVARLVAATSELGKNPTLATGFAAAENFMKELPGKLSTSAAQQDAVARVAEMKATIESVKKYTYGGTAF